MFLIKYKGFTFSVPCKNCHIILQLTSSTMGGFPTNAIAVLNFRLFPPLKINVIFVFSIAKLSSSPVRSTCFVCQFCKVHTHNFYVYNFFYLAFRDTT